MSAAATLDLNLHDKQGVAFETDATEVLYGGAAGGGKSHLMRVAAIVWCAAIPGLQVYLFRRIRDDLVKNHMEGPKGFRSMLAGWVQCKFVTIVDDEIRFWNGSKIYLCHCKDEKDIYKYQGAEIHVLLMDELTHFTESMYRFLRNRLRMVGVNVPEQYVGRFPRILAGANPGNIGHLWVKSTFVDNVRAFECRQMQPVEGGMLRQFIPALLEDNPSMTTDDPGYELRLQGLGSETLVQAMRYGNWDVVEGAFFDCWEPRRHIVRPFDIPKDWLRFMSGDWGSAKPFSFGWWAIATEPRQTENKDGQIITIPRGCMVRYREWYGASKPNTGLKLYADEVARGLAQREEKDGTKPSYRVLDPAAFAEDGGESIAAAMKTAKTATGASCGMYFKPADNARVSGRGAMGGWDQMRGRLKGDMDGNPMIVTFSTCHDSIRTIPAMQHDQARPEDMDSDGEDHAADEWRYGCMSRPWVRPVAEKTTPKHDSYKRPSQSAESWRV